eukprot:scaffold660_cov78-Phaeocystis_antarctica.AAC.3
MEYQVYPGTVLMIGARRRVEPNQARPLPRRRPQRLSRAPPRLQPAPRAMCARRCRRCPWRTSGRAARSLPSRPLIPCARAGQSHRRGAARYCRRRWRRG